MSITVVLCNICKSRVALRFPSNVAGYCSRTCRDLDMFCKGRYIDNPEQIQQMAESWHSVHPYPPTDSNRTERAQFKSVQDYRAKTQNKSNKEDK